MGDLLGFKKVMILPIFQMLGIVLCSMECTLNSTHDLFSFDLVDDCYVAFLCNKTLCSNEMLAQFPNGYIFWYKHERCLKNALHHFEKFFLHSNVMGDNIVIGSHKLKLNKKTYEHCYLKRK